MGAETDTKDRILDVAEHLFGERGVAGTSLRMLTAAAGVNLAAVHYHFGSKEALLRAVVLRRIGPLNQARLDQLARIQSDGALAPGRVEDLLDALLRPALERWGKRELEPLGFLFHEPLQTVGPLMGEVFGEVTGRFSTAFQQALPHLGREEVVQRTQFAIGTMVSVVSGRFHGSTGSSSPDPARAKAVLRNLISFLAPGMRAPSGAAQAS